MEKHRKTILSESVYNDSFVDLRTVWGFHPWFIFRTQTFYLLHTIETGHFKNIPKRSEFEKNITIKDCLKFIKTIFFVFTWRRKNFSRDLTNRAIVAGYMKHRYPINHENVNLYTDPAVSYFKKLGVDVLSFCFDRPTEDLYSVELHKYYKYLIGFYTFLTRLRLKFIPHDKLQLQKTRQNELMLKTWLKENACDEAESVASLVSLAVLRNHVAFKVFDKMCKVFRPKIVWTYSFYDNNVSAFCRAAKKNGIAFIDYQHSQQSDTHFAYAKWNDIDLISDFMPSKFWVWKSDDKERILRNFSGKVYKPIAVAGGNLFLSQRKISVAVTAGNGVLVSLQGQWIPEFVEEFIKADQRLQWFFRLHPRYPGDKDKLLKLKSECGDNIEIQQANELSLYEVFAKVSFNITAYSGVAIEANEFGIKNIIYGEKGYQTFKQYIDEKTFEFVNDEQSLQIALNNPYVETASESIIQPCEIIKENIKNLLS